MSEFVVRWKHWRYGPGFDGQVEAVKSHRLTPTWMTRLERRLQKWDDWRSVTMWNKMGVSCSQFGGKTTCYIYRSNSPEPNDLMLVAHAEAVCSWRDQFDRRVGRLYSLALALCELEADAKTKWDVFMQYGTHPMPYWACEAMADAWKVNNCAAVKRACAEIVASWKPKHNTMKREDANAGYRPLSSCLQAGDGDMMPCGHPRSAMVRGEYWGKDAEGKENYTMWCGKCSDEGSHHV